MTAPGVPATGTEPVGETFTRPNGKTYRPRQPGLVAAAWENTGYLEDSTGVIVFGTLDPDHARAYATQMATYWHSLSGVTGERPGWFRSGYINGAQAWLDDPVRGRPGVMFTACDVHEEGTR